MEKNKASDDKIKVSLGKDKGISGKGGGKSEVILSGALWDFFYNIT